MQGLILRQAELDEIAAKRLAQDGVFDICEFALPGIHPHYVKDHTPIHWKWFEDAFHCGLAILDEVSIAFFLNSAHLARRPCCYGGWGLACLYSVLLKTGLEVGERACDAIGDSIGIIYPDLLAIDSSLSAGQHGPEILHFTDDHRGHQRPEVCGICGGLHMRPSDRCLHPHGCDSQGMQSWGLARRRTRRAIPSLNTE